MAGSSSLMRVFVKVGLSGTAVCFMAIQLITIVLHDYHVLYSTKSTTTSKSSTSSNAHLNGFLQGYQSIELEENDLSWKIQDYEKRQFPSKPIVYLVHIHKSGGTALCNFAKFNLLSTSPHNCNVQLDQRCCGNQDTEQAQADYAQSTTYDFVAAEGRMYESMDLTHYSYILVLRQSLDRYYSHWKAVKQIYRQLPPSMQLEEDPEDELQAAGGIAGQAILTHHKAVAPLHDNQQMEANYAHMMDLVRETKGQRHARRQQKMAEMERWKQEAAHVQEEANKQPIQKTKPLPFQQGQQPRQPPPLPPDLNMEDLTVDAEKNKGFFFPHRRLADDSMLLQQLRVGLSPQSRKKLVKELHEQQHWHDDNKPPPLIPHPAQDPKTAFHAPPEGDADPTANKFPIPVFGRTFQEWWQAQPDNWNTRQLCGAKCEGIPKYQLTMQHWAYTLGRLFRFDTVLFLEDFDTSIQTLATRQAWNQSSIQAMNKAVYQHEAATAIDKAKKKQPATATRTDAEWREWYRKVKEDELLKKSRLPEEERRFKKQQYQKWDPLMSAVDDALYNVAQRWETLKRQKERQKQSTDLTNEELGTLIDLYSLPQQIHDMFQFYMDEDGTHREVCQNECCADQCSAW